MTPPPTRHEGEGGHLAPHHPLCVKTPTFTQMIFNQLQQTILIPLYMKRGNFITPKHHSFFFNQANQADQIINKVCPSPHMHEGGSFHQPPKKNSYILEMLEIKQTMSMLAGAQLDVPRF